MSEKHKDRQGKGIGAADICALIDRMPTDHREALCDFLKCITGAEDWCVEPYRASD
jgi:hypothetical protein